MQDVGGNNQRYTDLRAYYLDGGLYQTTDRNGNTPSTYTYDELGRTRFVTIPGTYDFTTYYLSRGLVDYTTHPLGAKTIYTYNARGQQTLVRRENANQSKQYDTSYTYDDAAQVTQVDMPESGQQKYTYDEIGRRRITDTLYTTSPSNAYITVKAEFNKNGAVTKSWDGRGNATTFTFGPRGQTASVTDPLSRSTSYTYDLNLRTTQVDMPDGKRTAYVLDKAGRTTDVKQYLNTGTPTYTTVSYAYDDNSQVTSTTDQNGNAWPKTYDAMGRNVTAVTPTIMGTSYTNTKYYDGVGNIVKVGDFASHNTEYTYNARNQRTRIRYKGAGGGGSDVDIDFSFNCCRMTAYDDTLGTSASLSYDDFARLTSHTDNLGNTLGYEYDGMNRVTKVTDHTSKDTTYAYDKAGRVSTIAYDPSGANRVTSYTYDGNSNAATTTYSNAYKSSFTYDNGNRVTQHKLQNAARPPQTLEQYDYNYSPGGLPSDTFGYTRAETATGDTYLIAFDRLNRINREKMTNGGTDLPPFLVPRGMCENIIHHAALPHAARSA